MRLTRREARKTCEACGATVAAPNATEGITKAQHFREAHPELAFHKQGTETFVCEQCGHKCNCFRGLVRHYEVAHNWLGVTNKELPTTILDSFFSQLGQVVIEVKTLRAEKAEWQARAARWAEKVIELQNIMARPS